MSADDGGSIFDVSISSFNFTHPLPVVPQIVSRHLDVHFGGVVPVLEAVWWQKHCYTYPRKVDKETEMMPVSSVGFYQTTYTIDVSTSGIIQFLNWPGFYKTRVKSVPV